MALHSCAACTTRYAPDLEACPNCGSTERARPGTTLPTVEVTCRTDGCPAQDRAQKVMLRPAAPGVLHMPQFLACARCGLAMELTRPYIGPHLAGGQQEETMPKITRLEGASIAEDPELDPGHDGPSGDAPGDSGREDPGTGEPMQPVDGQQEPSPDEQAPTAKTARRRSPRKSDAAPGAETSVDITAEAEVTRPDRTTT